MKNNRIKKLSDNAKLNLFTFFSQYLVNGSVDVNCFIFYNVKEWIEGENSF
jgi:hypothetical protein